MPSQEGRDTNISRLRAPPPAPSRAGRPRAGRGGGHIVGQEPGDLLPNLPLILGVLLVLRCVPEHGERRPLSLDVAGGLFGVLRLGGVVYALNEYSSSG